MIIEWGAPSTDPIILDPKLKSVNALSKMRDLFAEHQTSSPNDSTLIDGIMDKKPSQGHTTKENVSDLMRLFRLIKRGTPPEDAIRKINELRDSRSAIHTLIMWWDGKSYKSIHEGQRRYHAKGIALSVQSNVSGGIELFESRNNGWNPLVSLTEGNPQFGLTDYLYDYQSKSWEERLRLAYTNAGHAETYLDRYERFKTPYVNLGDVSIFGYRGNTTKYGRILNWPS